MPAQQGQREGREATRHHPHRPERALYQKTHHPRTANLWKALCAQVLKCTSSTSCQCVSPAELVGRSNSLDDGPTSLWRLASWTVAAQNNCKTHSVHNVGWTTSPPPHLPTTVSIRAQPDLLTFTWLCRQQSTALYTGFHTTEKERKASSTRNTFALSHSSACLFNALDIKTNCPWIPLHQLHEPLTQLQHRATNALHLNVQII